MNKKIILASVLSLSTIVLAGEKVKATTPVTDAATKATTTTTTATTATTTKATEAVKGAEEMKINLAGATDKNKSEIEKLAKEAGAKNAHYHNGALKVSGGFDAMKFADALKTKLPAVSVQN